MIIACPNCHSRVLPMADERCPSCLADTRAPKTTPLTSLQLTPGDELPSICVLCGSASADWFNLVEQETIGGENFLVKLIVFVFSPLRFARMPPELNGRTTELGLRLPLCATCKRADARPVPTFVNFARRTITLLVHDKFANAFIHGEPDVEVGNVGYRTPPSKR